MIERNLHKNKVTEHIIEIPGTVFETLIQIHGMAHVKENIYVDKSGDKFHLTKYGLEPNELFSMNNLQSMLRTEREKVSNQQQEITKLLEKIEKLKTK